MDQKNCLLLLYIIKMWPKESLYFSIDRIADPTGFATEIVGMSDQRSRTKVALGRRDWEPVRERERRLGEGLGLPAP
jgi:hypothetical protein